MVWNREIAGWGGNAGSQQQEAALMRLRTAPCWIDFCGRNRMHRNQVRSEYLITLGKLNVYQGLERRQFALAAARESIENLIQPLDSVFRGEKHRRALSALGVETADNGNRPARRHTRGDGDKAVIGCQDFARRITLRAIGRGLAVLRGNPRSGRATVRGAGRGC